VNHKITQVQVQGQAGTAALRSLVCASIFHLLFSAAAWAQASKDEDSIRKFLQGDREHHISYEEFVKSIATKVMLELDVDRNGELSRDEAAAASKESEEDVSVPVVAYVDSNAATDGRLNLEGLQRALRESAKVRSLYDDLDKEPSLASSETSLGPPRVLPQIRIRF
jgi:hypothetical protein